VPSVVLRAEVIESLGFKDFDALHLASAEAADVSVFLTTDDRLLRRARRQQQHLAVSVLNPLNWITKDERR
jgi:predicted nucleic acid-binding protein